MVRYERTDRVNTDEYEHNLRVNGCKILYDRDVLVEASKLMKTQSSIHCSLAFDRMYFRSKGTLVFDTKDVIYDYLTRFEGCPDHYFHSRKVQGITLSTKNCLQPLYDNGYAQEFLYHYIAYKSLQAKSSKLQKIIDSCRTPVAKSSDGKDLCAIPYTFKQEPNFRYNYSGYDIIAQIPKAYAHCISVEDDYVLAWGDFAQSDWRIGYNLFLRSEENDAMMLQYDDKYEALARMIARELGQTFDKEEFLEDRQLYKRLTLATMYGTENSVIKEEVAFIQKMTQFLQKCPRYVEYKNRLAISHELNLPIQIESYFGNVESSPIGYRVQDTVNRALNAPIQKGTSELVILTVNKILQRFRELGYTEQDISLLFTRHDEPIFKMKKHVMKDAWIFEDFTTIMIGGWTPINLEFSFGHYYNKVDEELMQEYQLVCNKNKDKIQFISPRIEVEDFYPVKPVLELQAIHAALDGESILTLYEERTNKAHTILVGSTDEDDIWNALVNTVRGMHTDVKYSGVVIWQTLHPLADEKYNGTYFVYKTSHAGNMRKAEAICRYTACVYCKQQGIECNVNPPLESMSELVHSAKKLEGFD